MTDKANQCDRILAMFERHQGNWVPLPMILALFIANYRARFSELRRKGYQIELRDEWVNGQRCTAYRLVRNRQLTIDQGWFDEADVSRIEHCGENG